MQKHETVPRFESIRALRGALEQKDRYEQINLYPRDGQELLGDAEEFAADVIGVNPSEVLIFGSGMAAIDTALEVGLRQMGQKHDSLIARSTVLYSQSAARIQSYGALGIKSAFFESGDREDVIEMLDRSPSVIFSETVGNGPGVPVLDHRIIIDSLRDSTDGPVTILDNTLPLSTGLALSEQITEEDKVIVVESGTKSYTQNGEISGIAYTKHPELLVALKGLRREKGNSTGVGSTDKVKSLLPEDRDEFNVRNLRLLKNTADIAAVLGRAGKETHGFVPFHPSLPDHPNYELAREIGLPYGGSPVIFIQPGSINQEALAHRIAESTETKQYINIGQSFGFNVARLYLDVPSGSVRVAGGANNKSTEDLCQGIHDALLG